MGQLVMELLLFHVSTKAALIRAVYNHNGISQDFKAMASDFGPVLYHEGLLGYLIAARPANACHPLKPPPSSNDSIDAFIVLIERYNCSFTTKVLHAQQAGYQAAVVHNAHSDKLVTMISENEAEKQTVAIPSLFIGASSATQLKRIFHYDPTAYLILVPEYHWLFCSDVTGYSCQSHPQKSRLGTPRQNFSCVPSQCICEVHYLLFGLMLMVWIAALYSLCCW
ncbi:UNVERIFIED_CONTAM: hypothetical protein K2H54_021456 [Gekko kuhli]